MDSKSYLLMQALKLVPALVLVALLAFNLFRLYTFMGQSIMAAMGG